MVIYNKNALLYNFTYNVYSELMVYSILAGHPSIVLYLSLHIIVLQCRK